MNPNLGQIGLTTEAHSWVEHMIEWVTQSSVHHVVICISDTECIGADPKGARIEPISYRKDIIWSQFPLTPEQAQASADWARAREGRPYSYINGFFIGMYRLFGINFPLAITRRFSTDKSYQCAQMGDAALTHGAGISVFDDGRLPGAVAPGDLEELFKARGWWTGAQR